MTQARFTKINESFSCLVCGFGVPKAQSTCRDHCPKCLYSIHVDCFPGDRQAVECSGLLKPISYTLHSKKGIMIHYQCVKCKMKKSNKFLELDSFCPDDYQTLLSLENGEPI